MIVEEAVDGGLQIDHALEDATLETALGEGREEDLDGVKEAEVTAVFFDNLALLGIYCGDFMW
jgi:hypothetical protein